MGKINSIDFALRLRLKLLLHCFGRLGSIAQQYNIIGLPGQTEADIKSTIKLNAHIDPDNITVAFYSPYIGTEMSQKAADQGMYSLMQDYVDGQLQTTVLDNYSDVSSETLNFYKSKFTQLVRDKPTANVLVSKKSRLDFGL